MKADTPDAVSVVLYAFIVLLVENVIINMMLVQMLQVYVFSVITRHMMRSKMADVKNSNFFTEVGQLSFFWRNAGMYCLLP